MHAACACPYACIRKTIASQSEVIRATVSDYSPYCGGFPHRPIELFEINASRGRFSWASEAPGRGHGVAGRGGGGGLELDAEGGLGEAARRSMKRQ